MMTTVSLLQVKSQHYACTLTSKASNLTYDDVVFVYCPSNCLVSQ